MGSLCRCSLCSASGQLPISQFYLFTGRPQSPILCPSFMAACTRCPLTDSVGLFPGGALPGSLLGHVARHGDGGAGRSRVLPCLVHPYRKKPARGSGRLALCRRTRRRCVRGAGVMGQALRSLSRHADRERLGGGCGIRAPLPNRAGRARRGGPWGSIGLCDFLWVGCPVDYSGDRRLLACLRTHGWKTSLPGRAAR